MAMEVAGTENWRRNWPAMRPISARCWPLEPPNCGWASSLGRPRVAAAVVRARFCRSARRVREWFGIGAGVPFAWGWEDFWVARGFYLAARAGVGKRAGLL